MLSWDCLAVQFTSFNELVHSTLWGGVEVAHDHAQGIAVALAHNVIHDIQQRPQLGNLHAENEHQDVQHCITVQFTSFNELVHSTLWGGVEVAHDHAQGIAVALAHNVIHDIQQRPQLGNLHAENEHQDVQHCITAFSSVCN